MKTRPMKMMLTFCLCGFGLAAAWAGPGPRRQVPTDATWFVTLDVEKLKTTKAGQFLLSEMDKPDAQQKLLAFQALFNFDPRKTLRSCTLFSRGSAPEDAVLLLEGQFDPEKLITLAKLGKEYQTSTHRGYTIHSWNDPKKKTKAGEPVRSFGAIHTNGVVALGQKAQRIGEALDVLDRARGSLDPSQLLPGGVSVADSTVLVGVARQSGIGQLPPNAAFLKNFKIMSLTAGETQDTLALDLVIETENEDAARNLLAIGQGLLAWVAFQGDKWGENTGAKKLLQGLTPSQKGALVTLSLRLPVTEAIQVVQEAEARKTGRRVRER